MDSLLQDLRFGARALRKHAGLTLVAVISLGAAIGAVTTIFTWLNTFVLNPLPSIPAAERLVVAHTKAPGGGFWNVSIPDAMDWRAGARAADLAVWDMMPMGLRDGAGETERAWGVPASGNYFQVLGVGAALGRVLTMDDEARRTPVAVLGHAYWKRHFAGDSSIVGRAITLNGSAYTIVGVAAPRFGGTYIGMAYHLYVPITTLPLLQADGAELLRDRMQRSVYVVGRLRPGFTAEQANAELGPMALHAGEAGGLAQPLEAVVRAHGNVDAPGALRPLLSALLALAGLVLLVACANVANLLLARAAARRREIAVRMAIGATRLRLVRQLFTESVALAAMAGAFGVVLSFWLRDGLMALLPAVPYPVGLDFSLSPTVLLFAIGVTAVTATAFGLMPALRASKPDLVPALKDEIGGGAGSRGRMAASLVAAQVALSLVTLVAAGLFVRSLGVIRSIDNGMRDLDRVMLVSTDLQLGGVSGDSLNVLTARALIDRVRALPGVEHAAIARSVVLGPAGLPSVPAEIEGYAPVAGENMNVSVNTVSSGYFGSIGTRLVSGRDVSDADMEANAPVVVVNEAFVRRYLPARDPLGGRVRVDGTWLSIVGVAATSKYNAYDESPRPALFRAYSAHWAPAGFTLHVRAAGDPRALMPAVREIFRSVSVQMPFLDPTVMDAFTSISYWPHKVGAIMLSAVGMLALLLASIGIYSTMAYSVSRRVREIGVRMALGAARADVLKLVLGHSMRVTAIGLVIGLAGALLVGQALRSQLLGVSATDPVTYGGVGLLLGVVALLASALPARRAARVSPMVALRAGE